MFYVDCGADIGDMGISFWGLLILGSRVWSITTGLRGPSTTWPGLSLFPSSERINNYHWVVSVFGQKHSSRTVKFLLIIPLLVH